MKKTFFQRFLTLLFIVALAGGAAMIMPVQAKKAPLEPPLPKPLSEAIIALDAGHGEDAAAIGAPGDCYGVAVFEADVNQAVREELTRLLGNKVKMVYQVPRLDSRRDRVAAAELAGADILISIHHNGSTDITLDYTETFITQRKVDLPLAKAIHPSLLASLGLDDHGITSTGFGMTVFGDHPAVLTEAYFITNTDAACDYLKGESGIRVEAEAKGLRDGIVAYFPSKEK